MEVVLLVSGAVLLAGYALKPPKPAIETEKQTKYSNIYTSDIVNEAKKKEQEIADKIVADPVYITGILGSTKGVESFGSINDLTQRYNSTSEDPYKNKIDRIEKKNVNFESAYTDDSYLESFDGTSSSVSKYTNESIMHDSSVMPFSSKETHEVRERFVQDPIEFRKKEVKTFTDGITVKNIHAGTLFDVGMDRYIPSKLKEGEKPFQPERVPAPKVGQDDAPTFKYKTLDELVVNPKESYKGRIILGNRQSAETRGLQAKVETNRQKTLTTKTFPLPTSFVKGAKAQEDYSTMKTTSKQDYVENNYIAPLQNSTLNNGLVPIENYTKSFKQDTSGIFTLNAVDLNSFTGDYQKSSISPVTTQRDTLDKVPLGNGNRADINPRLHPETLPKSTIKQSTLQKDVVTNVASRNKQGASDAVNSGISSNVAKTTMKQQNLTGYTGIAKGAPNGTYLVTKYNNKATFKEIIANRSEYTGIAGISQFNGIASRGETTINENKLVSEEKFPIRNASSESPNLDFKGMFGKSTTIAMDDDQVFDRNDESFRIR